MWSGPSAAALAVPRADNAQFGIGAWPAVAAAVGPRRGVRHRRRRGRGDAHRRGRHPERVRAEAAFAKLCGVSPIPASSGKTTRHRLNRGGHRHANAALYRAVIVRMQHHDPTKAYVARRMTEGKTKAEIIRCLTRLLAREIWAHMRPLRQRRNDLADAA